MYVIHVYQTKTLFAFPARLHHCEREDKSWIQNKWDATARIPPRSSLVRCPGTQNRRLARLYPIKHQNALGHALIHQAFGHG